MNQAWLGVTLLLIVPSFCKLEDEDDKYQNSLEALLSPTMCQLKLICAISQSKDHSLKNSDFMRGISVLAGYKRNITVPLLLERAITVGESGGSCTSVAPPCHHSDKELLAALADMGLAGRNLPDMGLAGRNLAGRRRVRRNVFRQYRRVQPWQRSGPYRRQGLGLGLGLGRQGLGLASMPPILRPELAGRRRVCRSCDQRSTVCTVYSVGTYAGCTGVWLVAGLPGQIACNVATAPGSIGCGMNTLHCYMSGCGLINLPRLP